ncbi:MAG: DUF58 domain-containing protein [Propionibacteriaceae bacterium]|nr:DUF58 domain-containing protein [Propionibacteriaceae bacterium]
MLWWSHLTGRGRTLLLIGALASGTALAAGERQILWLALSLTLLPLAALLTGAVVGPRLSVERQLSSTRTPAGQGVDVLLSLEQRRPFVPLFVELEERLSPQLGTGPAFSATRLTGPWRRRAAYRIRADVRGIFQVGPLLVSSGDALGLTTAQQVCLAPVELTVTPKVFELPAFRIGSGGTTSGEHRPHHLAIGGHDDALVREHRVGDGLRRVHWRSSARHGTLMVRREDSALDESATVLIDSRAEAYSSPSRFEWAVSAVTSAALRLVDQGFRVTILGPLGPVVTPVHDDVAARREDILAAMTRIQLSPSADLQFAGHPSSASRIAVLGRITPEDATRLTGTGRHTPGWALLLGDSPDAADILATRGWRVLPVPPEMAVDAAWRTIGGLR